MMNLFIIIFLLLGMLSLIYYYKKIFFFRDPLRTPPPGENLILSPADGNIVYIKKFTKGKVVSQKNNESIKISEITKVPHFNNGSGWIIGVYMKPFDVHFNYAPITGEVKKIVYTKSKFNLPMVDLWEYIPVIIFRRMVNFWSKKFHLQNERNVIFLENDKNLKLVIVEIADKFVNKIDCFIKEGQKLKKGQKISFIRHGSQVDLIIYKKDVNFKVKVGDQVYGGETILAFY